MSAAIALLAWPAAAMAAPPANDDYPGTDLGSSNPVNVTGTNVDATSQAGEPASIDGVWTSHTVWWTWTSPVDGIARVDTCDSDLDTVLGVFTDSDDVLPVETTIGENDDEGGGCANFGSAVEFTAVEGQAYRIMVGGYQDEKDGFDLRISVHPVPENDDWEDRLTVGPDLPATVNGTNERATVEVGEPTIPAGGGQAGATVWYAFTPTVTGEVAVSTCGAPFDTVAAAFTGNSLASLSQVAGADDDCTGGGDGSYFTFQATAGTEYSIAVGGWGSDAFGPFAEGEFTLELTRITPVNDYYPGTDLGSDASVNVTGTNVNATSEAGEPSELDGRPTARSVWWTWTAPADGYVQVSTCGSDFDTLLGVFTDGDGVLPVDSLVAENDDDDQFACGVDSSQSAVSFGAEEGDTYRVMVDGYAGTMGQIGLEITLEPAPGNDDWANREPIGPGLPASAAGTNRHATVEPGEPELPGNGGVGGRTVWYGFTPNGSGEVTVSTCGADFDTVVSVFTGGALASLEQVGGGDDGCTAGGGTKFTFAAQAGTEYSIGVGGYYDPNGTEEPQQGAFTLTLDGDPSGPADPGPSGPGTTEPPGSGGAANTACEDAKAALGKAKQKVTKAKARLKKAKANGNADAVKKAKKKVKKAKKKLKAAKAAANAACATG